MGTYRPTLNKYEKEDSLWWCRHHKENSIYLSKIILELSEETDMDIIRSELSRLANVTAKNILKHDIKE